MKWTEKETWFLVVGPDMAWIALPLEVILVINTLVFIQIFPINVILWKKIALSIIA